MCAANTHFPDVFWLMWQRFDSGFYLNLAKSGYWSASTLHTYSNWAFFPLFPLLIFLLAHLFGGSETAFSLAGLFVSNAAALIAVTYLYKLTQREFGANIASLSVIYLALFPTAFYLSVIYTESLFLACSVACIYYARKQRWWLSGLLAFMIYGKIKTGHLLATFDNQKWGWGRSFENPLQLLSTALTNPQRANPMDWNFWILNVCFALLFLGFTVWAFRKLPMIYALFTLVMVLLPLSSSRLNSISRYYLLVFPVFILLALWSKNVEHANRRFLIMTLFAMLQAVLMVFFVLGIPAIA